MLPGALVHDYDAGDMLHGALVHVYDAGDMLPGALVHVHDAGSMLPGDRTPLSVDRTPRRHARPGAPAATR